MTTSLLEVVKTVSTDPRPIDPQYLFLYHLPRRLVRLRQRLLQERLRSPDPLPRGAIPGEWVCPLH